jgi:hypothetical protein
MQNMRVAMNRRSKLAQLVDPRWRGQVAPAVIEAERVRGLAIDHQLEFHR